MCTYLYIIMYECIRVRTPSHLSLGTDILKNFLHTVCPGTVVSTPFLSSDLIVWSFTYITVVIQL